MPVLPLVIWLARKRQAGAETMPHDPGLKSCLQSGDLVAEKLLLYGHLVAEKTPLLLNHCPMDPDSSHACNLWLVRYMYIPLGGACWRLLNVWLIFTFVGVWHDLEWRLLSWAWIMALFMAPELAVKSLAQAKCMAHVKGTWVYRHMCAAAASINILVLMTANMVGFVLGAEGVLPILRKISSDTGFMVVIMATLFCASHLMFAIRDGEKGQLPWLASLCPWACRGGRGELPQGTTATKDEDRKV
eukprot:gene10661-12343_t